MALLHSLLLLAFATTLSCDAARTQAQLAAQIKATSWLQEHEDPDAAALEELRNTNPDAFAIVNALMMKKSLGLLDPMHPTTSMVNHATPVSEKAFETHAASASDTPDVEEEVSVPTSHKNWLNWKPAESAADDATVASLKEGSAVTEGDAPSSESEPLKMPSFNWGVAPSHTSPATEAATSTDATQAAPAAEVATPASTTLAPRNTGRASWASMFSKPSLKIAPKVAASASNNQDNFFLKGIDFSSDLTPAAPRKSALQHVKKLAAGQENSYMSDLNLDSNGKQAPIGQSSEALASFSWGDDSSKPKPNTGMIQKQKVALSNWLSDA